MIDIATAPERCGDGRQIVATAIGNHKVTLNTGPGIAMVEVGPKLREFLKYRAAKEVFVRAEGDVTFADFMELVDNVRPEAEVVSLITPQVYVLVRRGACGPCCGSCDYGKP